ncbi:hypothetical protein St703_11130 [Sporolactobacillus terrae]|uniref:Uncharacterized protein n=1 Tax=Sporolactobacillus terrae TaxID=269673 RepID=A0A5K7X0J4_9BACL|nr:hypothetical protein St703_11130 [Sporolactobacillus terrae]
MLISMAWREMLTDKKYDELTDKLTQELWCCLVHLGKWLTERVDQNLTPCVIKNYLR